MHHGFAALAPCHQVSLPGDRLVSHDVSDATNFSQGWPSPHIPLIQSTEGG
jgi:hypothetical protein